jgi:hypothetical protein
MDQKPILTGILRVAMALLAALFPAAATAGDLEVTPFAGYTWGGQFTDSVTGTSLKVDETTDYGIIVDFKQEELSYVELYFSRQATQLQADKGALTGNPLFDLDIEYYHIGGTIGKGSGKVQSFMAATIGATHMVPKGPGLDALTKPSFSFGGGVKLFATDRIGLRLDGRWFGTVFNGSGSAFCSSGACAIELQGHLFSQFVANAGLIIVF